MSDEKSATVHCNECHKDVSTSEAERCAECKECPFRDVTPFWGGGCWTLVIIVLLCAAIVTAIVFALRLTDVQ